MSTPEAPTTGPTRHKNVLAFGPRTRTARAYELVRGWWNAMLKREGDWWLNELPPFPKDGEFTADDEARIIFAAGWLEGQAADLRAALAEMGRPSEQRQS